MNAADRAHLERIEKRLTAIEQDEHAQLVVLRRLADVLEDVVIGKTERDQSTVPTGRHLRLVGRDE